MSLNISSCTWRCHPNSSSTIASSNFKALRYSSYSPTHSSLFATLTSVSATLIPFPDPHHPLPRKASDDAFHRFTLVKYARTMVSGLCQQVSFSLSRLPPVSHLISRSRCPFLSILLSFFICILITITPSHHHTLYNSPTLPHYPYLVM